MKKTALHIIVFLIPIYIFGQGGIFNPELLRQRTTKKWTGSVSLNIGLVKNTNKIFWASNTDYLQYKDSINYWLVYSNISLQKLEGDPLVNSGIQHLRYNYTITEKTKLEAFVQAQYDAVSQIDFRGLVGLGPRFKLSKRDSIYRIYLGTLVMYEHEKSADIMGKKIHKDFRGSAYLSFSIYPIKTMTIASTTFYQPNLKAFGDYRLSNNTTLEFEILEKLSFTTSFNYNFDAYPVEGIPKAQYELTNGLKYDF